MGRREKQGRRCAEPRADGRATGEGGSRARGGGKHGRRTDAGRDKRKLRPRPAREVTVPLGVDAPRYRCPLIPSCLSS